MKNLDSAAELVEEGESREGRTLIVCNIAITAATHANGLTLVNLITKAREGEVEVVLELSPHPNAKNG